MDCLEQARASFAGYTFGDAGAAVVVEPVSSGGLLDVDTETQSEHWSVGGIFGGGSRHPRDEQYTYFEGDGRALRGVFEKMGTGILDRVRDRTGLDWDDFTKVLVHQVTVQALPLHGDLAAAEPKKLRYRLLHVAARITCSGRQTRLRIAGSWPWAHRSRRRLRPAGRGADTGDLTSHRQGR